MLAVPEPFKKLRSLHVVEKFKVTAGEPTAPVPLPLRVLKP